MSFTLVARRLQLSRAIFALLVLASGPVLRAFDLPAQPDKVIQRVAFGSCNNSTQPAPVWDAVVKADPQVWLWLGDTVYADVPRPSGDTLEERTRVVLDRLPDLYGRQRALPAYQRLMSRALIMGTWDDHDYGLNDMGADFPGRAEAQQHFFDFYGEPKDSPRRTRPGVYSSIVLGPSGKRVQIVVLDTRSFRSPLEDGNFPKDQRVKKTRVGQQQVLMAIPVVLIPQLPAGPTVNMMDLQRRAKLRLMSVLTWLRLAQQKIMPLPPVMGKLWKCLKII